MGLENEILKNIRGYLKSANKIYSDSEYTAACVLYFKALFAVIDYELLKSGYGIPKDHSERFRLLERKFPILYKLLDKLFPIYQRTYSLSIDKPTCKTVKENVENLIEKLKIPV